MNKSSLYSFIVHINPEQMVNLVSFCNFVVDVIKNIKFYSLFVKSFTIHRTIKVPGTFKFFTISQSCYKSHIVFCNIVYQSYNLFLWQVLFCPHNPTGGTSGRQGTAHSSEVTRQVVLVEEELPTLQK